MIEPVIVGLTARGNRETGGPVCHALAVYRLAAPQGPEQQLRVSRALLEIGALRVAPDSLDELDEPSSLFVAGALDPPAAEREEAFRAALTSAARSLGLEAAHFFQIGTEIDDGAGEQTWRAGPPPGASEAPFPFDGFAEALERKEHDDFQLTVMLAGAPRAGELTVLDAFHSFWMRAYVDSRRGVLSFRPLAIERDLAKRTAVLALDHCGALRVTAAEMARHALWVLGALHQVLPIAHVTFGADERAGSETVPLVTDATFTEQVLRHDQPVLVDFTASWCGPCKALAPVIDKLAAGSGGAFRVVKLDVDRSRRTAEQHGVLSMPTVIVFRDGEEIARHVGLTSYETLARLVTSATRTASSS